MADHALAELSAADAEIEEMQKKVREMEEETEKLKQLTEGAEEPADNNPTEEIDARSVYVGSVDYGSTPEEVQEHFKSCGEINRITILVDKWTGSPKGFAYIEFGDLQGVQNSLLLDGSLFRGRQLKVAKKRTNLPGFMKGKGKGGGKGFKGGKGGFKGGFMDEWADPWGQGYGYGPWGGKGKGKYFSPY